MKTLKTLTFLILALSLIIFVPSIIFAWVNVFFTTTTIIYIVGALAIIMAVTGAKKDLEKKS